MKLGIAVLVAFVAAGCVALPVKRYLGRVFRVRRLEACEASVEKAVADGRLSSATGEALLQHLEGLRRECSGVGGG